VSHPRRAPLTALAVVLLASALALKSQYQPAVVSAAARPHTSSHYVFAWAGDSAQKASDFLAVIDVDPKSPRYASVVATLPVGEIGTGPHHTEHLMSPGGVLYVNGFRAGRTFMIDLKDPLHPKLNGAFGDLEGYSHPHSFVRLPNGNVMATFQMRMDGNHETTGGLVELRPDGTPIRSASAADAAVDTAVRPYSVAILPKIDRMVSTAMDMHGTLYSRAIQIWRLSDLHLLHTVLLPPGPRGDENSWTAEPRVMPDGRTVVVNTFHCGMYHVSGIETKHPAAHWMRSSEWQEDQLCAIPVTTGHFWVQTLGAEHAVITLDISDPLHPREVSRVSFGPNDVPHWIALEPNEHRILLTGYAGLTTRLMLLDFNPETGALAVDSTFKEPGASVPGFSFARSTWPHGVSGTAIPHGAVFNLPAE